MFLLNKPFNILIIAFRFYITKINRHTYKVIAVKLIKRLTIFLIFIMKTHKNFVLLRLLWFEGVVHSKKLSYIIFHLLARVINQIVISSVIKRHLNCFFDCFFAFRPINY